MADEQLSDDDFIEEVTAKAKQEIREEDIAEEEDRVLKENAYQVIERRASESGVEFNELLITPTQLKDSYYHSLVTKDLAVSNLGNPDVGLVMKYFSLINLLVFLNCPAIATLYHAEMLAFLNAKRSIGGKERELLATVIQRILKSEEVKKQGFFQK